MAQTATVSPDHRLSGLWGLRQLGEASSAQPLPWVRSSGGCGWDHLRGFLTRVSAAWCRLSFKTTPGTVRWKICTRCPQVHWTFSPLTSGIKSKWGVWGERWGKAGRSGWSYSVKVLVAESCPTLRDPMDGSPPGSSVHGISQARTLEWAAIPSSRGSSQPREWPRSPAIAGGFFTIWAIRKPGWPYITSLFSNKLYLGITLDFQKNCKQVKSFYTCLTQVHFPLTLPC